MILSVPKFAAHCGVSKQAAYQAVEEGRIVRTLAGVDTKHETNIAYMELQQQKKLGEAAAYMQPVEEPYQEDTADIMPDIESINPDGSKDIVEDGETIDIPPEVKTVKIGGITRPQAELIRIIRQSDKIDLEMKMKRKEYIPRDLVVGLFGKFQEIDINLSDTMPDRVMPQIAGVFECTDENKIRQAKKILADSIYEVREMSKSAFDKFLEKTKDELKNS